jgi:hypothetical protein
LKRSFEHATNEDGRWNFASAFINTFPGNEPQADTREPKVLLFAVSGRIEREHTQFPFAEKELGIPDSGCLLVLQGSRRFQSPRRVAYRIPTRRNGPVLFGVPVFRDLNVQAQEKVGDDGRLIHCVEYADVGGCKKKPAGPRPGQEL